MSIRKHAHTRIFVKKQANMTIKSATRRMYQLFRLQIFEIPEKLRTNPHSHLSEIFVYFRRKF